MSSRRSHNSAGGDGEAFTLPAQDLEMVAGALGRCEGALRGARFLITGGTGFFGIWLAESLLYMDQTLGLGIALDLLTRSPEDSAKRMPQVACAKSIRLIPGDVRRYEPAGERYDYVIHAATESGGAQKSHSGLHMAETIVEGTRHILEASLGANAKAVLSLSSGAVYGRRAPLDRETFDEDYPGGPLATDPDIAHDEGKRMAEALCALYARERDLAVKIARCFTFVGPYLPLDAHFAIGNFIGSAVEGRPIIIKGDGTPVRTYMYMADLVIWLITILIDSQAGRPYNVGGSEAISMRDLAARVAGCIDPPVPIEILAKAAPGSAVSRIVPNTRRAETELGLTCRVGLDEAIRRTIAWYRGRNPA